jgi:hypothetical protein
MSTIPGSLWLAQNLALVAPVTLNVGWEPHPSRSQRLFFTFTIPGSLWLAQNLTLVDPATLNVGWESHPSRSQRLLTTFTIPGSLWFAQNLALVEPATLKNERMLHPSRSQRFGMIATGDRWRPWPLTPCLYIPSTRAAKARAPLKHAAVASVDIGFLLGVFL